VALARDHPVLGALDAGRLDAARAWRTLTGPRVLLYHTEDGIIDYEKASLHRALQSHGEAALRDATVIRLSNTGSEGPDYHNLPLQVHPAFQGRLGVPPGPESGPVVSLSRSFQSIASSSPSCVKS
jgi:hypothetical protein